MSRSAKSATALVVGTATLALAVTSGCNTVGAKVTIAGVGSDTTQGVMGAYAAAYNGANKVIYPGVIGSYNATGTATIVTKPGCVAITRPNGSGAGITALRNDTKHCIDFARSSRSKKTDGTENSLSFFAYGLDAVSVATVIAKPSLAAINFSTAQLTSIYTCQTRDWHAISAALPHGTIHPYLPQTGSGTRAFFLKAINLDDSKVGGCVNQKIEENTGTELKGDKLGIEPYSIAVWLAQRSKVLPDNRGGVSVRSIVGKAPTSGNSINPAFPSNYKRLIFNVVRASDAAKFSTVFGPRGYICSNQALVARYGFGKLGAGCGAKF